MPQRKKNIAQSRTIFGDALWQALGFGSLRSFQRARQRGDKIPVQLYPVTGQKGVYALRSDVEAWQMANDELELGGSR